MDTDLPPDASSAGIRRRRTRGALLVGLLATASAVPVAVLSLYGAARWATGDSGLARLAPDQVGLLVDHLSGETRVLGRTGYHLYLPWLQDVLVFERGARTVRLGPGTSDDEPVDVRARDGSTFSFTGLELVLRPDAERLPELAAHFGTAFSARSQFASAAARALVAEEFGRLAAQEATDGQLLAGGRLAARERLAERLAPRGLLLEDLATPKPRLEREVEKAIDERKLVRAEADRLQLEVERAESRRPRRLETLEATHAKERVALDGEHASQLLAARTQADEKVANAALARDARVAAAERRSAELLAEAERTRTDAERAAARLGEEAAALEAAGPLAVREALIATLARTPIRVLLGDDAEGGKP